MKNYILNLLNIEDRNIFILPNIEERNIKNKKYKIIEGILTYIPDFCPCCGCVNESHNSIIKWGYRKNCKVKIPKISNCFSLLILHKQRFFCRNYNKTFIAKTSLIDKNKNISNNTELQINLELMIKQSEKDISKRLDVSVSKIDRKLSEISSHTVLRYPTLPESINQDEFKATKNTKGKLAFIITDNNKGKIFDIQDSRKSIDLDKYFRRYSKDERDKVKHISTDFYSGYIFLAKKLFKNAEISIDRFHIVIQAYNALNTTRIRLCYKSNPNYNKLKDYWKLLLKNENELSDKKYASLWNNAIFGSVDSVEYVKWRQTDPKWSSIKVGNSSGTLGSIGCLITSISILIEKSGCNTMIKPFNPGTFLEELNKNNGFDGNGNLQYAAVTKAVPAFKYVGNQNLRGKSKEEKLSIIKQYLDSGHYLTAEVKGATKGSQHWVAVTKVDGNSVIMVDPGSNQTIMWNAYNYEKTSQFNYFKVEQVGNNLYLFFL